MSSVSEAEAPVETPGPQPLLTNAELRKIGLRYRLKQSAIFVVGIFVATQIGSLIYGAARPDAFAYTSSPNLITAFQQIPLVGIVALGVGLLMIAGEFDLSVGANSVFSSIAVAQLFGNGMNIWLAALIGILIGAGIGFLNGVLTMALHIPSFIATLGTLGIWSAATLYIHGAATQDFTPTGAFLSLTAGQKGDIPSELIWFLLLAVIFYFVLQRSSVGNHIFAAGGNKAAATASGVNVVKAKLVAFTVTGALAAVSGILAASRVTAISPTSTTDLALQSIAACVIGGVILAGGSGPILGIMVGAALIYWIQDVLLLAAAPGYYLTAFVGGLTIVAAWSYEMFRRRNV